MSGVVHDVLVDVERAKASSITEEAAYARVEQPPARAVEQRFSSPLTVEDWNLHDVAGDAG